MQGVEFRLFGPISMYYGSEPVGLGSTRNRSILAALLLEPNRVVPVERLIAAAWDEDPPAGARVQAQNRVSALRKAFRNAVPGEDLISTAGSGYAIRVREGELDVDRFARAVERAESLAGAGEYAGAVGELSRALALWHGPALHGQSSAPLRAAAQRLEEQRLHAVERRLQARASLGEHAQLVAELADLIQEHPYRERLRAVLMLVLHRCGRSADALQAYLETRNVFAEELGIAPSELLRRLHQAVLETDESALDEIGAELGIVNAARVSGPRVVAPPAAVPRELPLDLAGFTGREAEIATLTGQLEAGGLVAIHGPGGAGKSALAVHLGHRLAERFGDGQLYANLRGAAPDVDPLQPAEVLAQFLRALGTGSQALAGTANVDELAARYRSATSGKRILVLLDDAADSAQIRPLLPGSASCAVLVTSRRLLAWADGGGQHRLGPFPEEDAEALLVRLVSDSRVREASPVAVGELLQLCDRLPLALSIAAGRLNARPTLSVATLVSRLRDQRRRLDELTHEDRAVRACFLVSYQDLIAHPVGAEAGQLFRLAGLLDVPDFGVSLAAAVAGCTEAVAEKLLDLLVDAQLVENETPGRYRMHDLLRLYARERALAEEPVAGQTAALRRAFAYYLATARNASLAIRPMRGLLVDLEPRELEHAGVPLRTHDEAVGWIESERGNLLAVMKQAAGTPAIGPEAVIALSSALLNPLGYAGFGRDQMAVHEIAYLASAQTSSPSHLAVTAFVRGGVLHAQRPDEAASWLERARDLWRDLGNTHGESLALTHLGTTYGVLERHEESLASLEAGLQLVRAAGDIEGESACLDHLGIAYRRLGRKNEAIAAHSQAHQLSLGIGYRAGETITAANLATALHIFGDLEAAQPAYEHALDLARRDGNRQVEAECLWGLADVLTQLGRTAQGRAHRRAAAEILVALGWITPAESQAITAQPHPPVPPGFWTNI